MAGRDIFKAVTLLFAAAILACWCTLPLIWDGGYQFTLTLIQQEPYFYLTRFHSGVLWLPLVWLSAHTDNLTVLMLAYGLPFLAAPAVGVALSWWVVRRHAPGLVLWALFGVAAAVPGQAFVINDSMWQHMIFWPVFLGALVPLDWPKRAVLLAVATFQFSHQIGTAFLGIAATAAWVVAWRVPAMRREALPKGIVLGALTLLAAAKAMWVSVPEWSGRFYDSYAAQQASIFEVLTTFVLGVFHFPLAGMVCLWVVAWRLVRRGALERNSWRLVTLAGILWTLWALFPLLWSSAIFYRRWVLPMAFPFCCLALYDALRAGRGESAPAADRGRLALRLASIFAIVLSIQSVTWALSIGNLLGQAASRATPVLRKSNLPCLGREQLDKWGVSAVFAALHSPPPASTPMDHWGITATFMALQGREPSQYLAYDDESYQQITAAPHLVPLCKQHPVQPVPGPAGYYDHRPLLLRTVGQGAN